MDRFVRWEIAAAALIMLGIGGYFVFFRRASPAPSPPRVDPTRPIVDVQIPLVDVAQDRATAFVLPEEVVVPSRATVRIKGKFRTGSRKGRAPIFGEARVPSTSGRTALFTNGMTRAEMREGSDCDFELLMHFPQQVRSGILEIRLKDEFLATGRFRAER